MVFFKFPSLTTKRGKVVWVPIVLIYWALAFSIGAAVPQFSNISGLVAAICIFQFTYSFPPLLALGYQIQADAALGDSEFNPASPMAHRIDSWRQFSRWKRGGEFHLLDFSHAMLYSHRRLVIPKLWLKTWYLVFGLASLAAAGLGAYSSIEGIIKGFKKDGAATSFTCRSPVE